MQLLISFLTGFLFVSRSSLPHHQIINPSSNFSDESSRSVSALKTFRLPSEMNNKNNNDDDGWASVPKKGDSHKRQRDQQNDAWNVPPIMVEYIPPPSSLEFEPFLLLLVGLPGSGKSTFASMLESAMPYKVGLRGGHYAAI